VSEDLDGGSDLRSGGASAVEAVNSHEDLVKLLTEEFARADASLRELQARADRAGGARLPRATCADMLAGRRFPKKAVMMAFLRACRVPEQQLPAWERAWERVRIAHLSTAPPTEPDHTAAIDRAAHQGPIPHTVVPPASHRRRRTPLLVLAMLSVLAISAAIVAGGLWGRPRTTTDDGRAFGPGGSSRFTVSVDPANTGVRLIRLLDANVPQQRAAITVNGAPAGEWKPLLGSTGWGYQSADLPARLTTGRGSLTIVNTFVSSLWDFNEFRYVVQHQINGAWSTADTVDIGPGHTDSEAAHDYHITGQTFRGSRTFSSSEAGETIE
jgi:hypothetical protein